MQDEIFPRHYEAWKKCISEKCRIPLSPEFINQRIEALSREDSKERQIFSEKYGSHWTNTVLNYFKQARSELSKQP